MNKLAQIQTENSIDQSSPKTSLKNDLSDPEALFLKKKMGSEIRMRLAKFANEISNARKERNRN